MLRPPSGDVVRGGKVGACPRLGEVWGLWKSSSSRFTMMLTWPRNRPRPAGGKEAGVAGCSGPYLEKDGALGVEELGCAGGCGQVVDRKDASR